MKIMLASDHAGYDYREYIKEYLLSKGHEVIDLGCDSKESTDYPLFGYKLGKEVVTSNCIGVGVCGTGIGMAMACNKVSGARAAVVDSISTAMLCRKHNDANIVCIGSRIVAKELAVEIVQTFLDTAFEGGRHQRRVEMLDRSDEYVR